MKKYIYGSLACFLLLWTGCNKEESVPQHDEGTGTRVLQVKVETLADSRTGLGENNQVLWVEGDQIGVFVEGESTPVPFTYTGMSGDIANFSGTLPEGKLVAAYYPYNETAKLNGTGLSVKLPSDYEYTENTNGPMLGQPDGENGFFFKHLCGLLRVTIEDIPAGATKLTVGRVDWLATEPAFQGSFVVEDITIDEPVLKVDDWSGTESVNYNFTSDFAGQNKTFYIPVAPTSKAYNIDVSLRNAENQSLWYKRGTVAITRGSILNMPSVDTTLPLVSITSPKNEYSFNGCKTYTTTSLSGVAKNFERLDKVVINLQTETNGRHDEYNLFNNSRNLRGSELEFEQVVDVYPGKNVYTISWTGLDTGGNNVEGETTFIINYEEMPTVAEAVDLGLSVKWASHNIGAAKASDYGGLYVWADKTGTDLRHEDNYSGVADSEITIISGNSEYDIATHKWGDLWRMPTAEEFQELIDNCEASEDEVDGIKGVRFTAQNGNSIFLPAGGSNYGYHDLRDRGTVCRYWTGGEYADIMGHQYSEIAYYQYNYARPTFGHEVGHLYWTFGCSVRPVYGVLSE